MHSRHPLTRLLYTVSLFLFTMAGTGAAAWAQTGHVLNGVGPVDQSWSGAGMALPQDALTSLHWNPATMTTFDGQTLDVSIQLLFPSTDLSSTIESDAMGPDNPPVRLSGTTSSEAGPFPIPAAGFISRQESSRWAFGLSSFGVGGFGVDYSMNNPQSPDANPITFPQEAGGFGALNSSFALFQISPTVAYRVTDNVSIGVAPTFNVGMLEVSPFPAARPDQTGYPNGPQTRAAGLGFQAGIHATNLAGFHVGVSYKSTQRFASYDFQTDARTFSFDLDYPKIVSAAVGYSGLNRVKLVADARYIDFENTEGFRTVGFDEFGAVKGFGWNSILVIATGVEYELTERVPIRLGYSYNENPIDDAMSFYNVASPAVVQHHFSGGLSYRLNDRVTLSGAVQYAPANAVTSCIHNPQYEQIAGTTEVPGTSVQNELSTVTAVMGMNLTF